MCIIREMKENTVFYIFFILFWIYLVYSLYNQGKFKEDFLSFPVSMFKRSQSELSETDYGKRTKIKEEIHPTRFLELIRPILPIKPGSLLEKNGLKTHILESLTLYTNISIKNGSPNPNYDNPYRFSKVDQLIDYKTHQLEFLYEPKEYELKVNIVDPREAMKVIQKTQNLVVNKNKDMKREKEKLQPILNKVKIDLLNLVNRKQFLESVRPFPKAIIEPYKIDELQPVFIYRDKSNRLNKKGAIIEGLLHRYNKYFVYHFVAEITIINHNRYILHSFHIISFKSSEDIPQSFGSYTNTMKSDKICKISDTENDSFCNPSNVIPYEEMIKDINTGDDMYEDKQSYRCIGKYVFNRDECISPTPESGKIGKWVKTTFISYSPFCLNAAQSYSQYNS